MLVKTMSGTEEMGVRDAVDYAISQEAYHASGEIEALRAKVDALQRVLGSMLDRFPEAQAVEILEESTMVSIEHD